MYTKFLCGCSKLMGLIRLDGVHWGKVGITTDFVISWNIEAFKRIQQKKKKKKEYSTQTLALPFVTEKVLLQLVDIWEAELDLIVF